MDRKMEILGVKVSVTNLAAACETIGQWISVKQKAYICIAPVSTIVECQKDEQYRLIVNKADMTTPDGMPLVWLGRVKGEKTIGRTYGPDLLLRLCELSQKTGYRHYFFGGSAKTIQLLPLRLKEQFPKLNIVGNFSPPFRDGYDQENEEIINKINAANPDILWVGLGSPKQDYWMHVHRSKLNCPVIVGVGAAFDFVAGTKPQAPIWMRRIGLEWFFRLVCEPHRLWRRYLIGNTQFIYLLIKDLFKNRSGSYVAN